MTSPLEDELRAALRAAADGIDTDHPERNPFIDHALRVQQVARRRSARRAWLGAAAVAAAVAAIVVPLALTSDPRSADTGPAAGLTVSGDTATVDGVTFPIPAGTHVDVLADTPLSIAVCVQAARSSDCSGGTTVTIARADSTGHYTQLPNPILDFKCQWVELWGRQVLGGRDAGVHKVGCGATEQDLRSLTWYLVDGTMLIVATPAADPADAQQLANGMNLDRWANTGELPVATRSS